MNIKILTLLLFLLISVSAVSATDINDNSQILASDDKTDVVAMSNNSNVLENDNEIQNIYSDLLADGDAGTLTDLAADIGTGGNVELNRSYKYTDGDPLYVTISTDTEIEGKGHVIDLNGHAALFSISGATTITLKNLIVMGGTNVGHRNSIIFSDGDMNINLDNCTFYNNNGEDLARLFGDVNTNNGVSSVTNSKFIDNTVSYCLFHLSARGSGIINNNVFIRNTVGQFILTDGMTDSWVFNNNVIIGNSINRIDASFYAFQIDDNYWGRNDATPGNSLVGDSYGSFTIAKMNVTYPSDDPLEEAREIEINFDKPLPEFDLGVSAVPSNIVLNTTVVTLGGGKTAKILVTPKSKGTSTFTLGSNLRTPLDTHVFNSAGAPRENVTIEWVNKTIEMYQGDNEVLSVIVKNETTGEFLTGIDVTFKLNTDSKVIATDSNGIATYNLSRLNPNNYTVTVNVDTENLTSDDLNSTLKVKEIKALYWFYGSELINKTTTIQAHYSFPSITSLSVMDPNISEIPEGTQIVVTIGNTVINTKTEHDGYYEVPLSGINVGTYNITFNTEGYYGTQATFKLIPIDTIVTLEGANTQEYGNPTTLTANITDIGMENPITEGSVSFYINGVLNKTVDVDSEGKAVLELGNLPVNNYTVIANYTHPVGNYKNSTSGEKKFSITKIATVINVTNTTVYLNATGEIATGATLTPADAGNLTYTSSNKTVAIVENGKIKALSEGTAIITVSFNGDEIYAAAENKSIEITVTLNDASISVNNSTLDLMIGENSTIITTTQPEGLDVTFKSNNESVVTVDNKGNVVAVGKGTATITASVGGDGVYALNSTTVAVSVKEDTSVNITAPDVTKYYKEPENFVVTVTNNKGNPLADKSVSILINGIAYSRTTNKNGTAEIAINLPSNTYNVTTTVDNQSVNSVITVLTTVNGTDIVKMYKNATQYYATFIDTQGKYLADGTAVQFSINGVVYDRKVSGDKGQAKLNINLPQGKYIITAINSVTGENAANNITVLPSITENRDIIKYYKNATQYTVKILGDNGKAVGEGEIVTFNVNGVLYNRQTNASGIAALNINLVPGDYIITASYKGCNVANNITVLPVLNASDLKMKYGDGSKFKANLVDGQGKPYSGQTIQFNINGVLYSKVTDSTGQAELNINLIAGEYIITSSYNGSNIANKITVS